MKPIFEQYDGGVFLSYEGHDLDENEEKKLRDKWEDLCEGDELDEMLDTAKKIASPKAFIRQAAVDKVSAEEKYVILSGIRFDSELLADKLSPIYSGGSGYVYPNVTTCGHELHDWAVSQDDVFLRGLADDICLTYMRKAGGGLREYAAQNYYEGKYFSAMNPGSIKSWPLTGQEALFRLLGEGGKRTGVTLTDSFLMIPFKSGSGLYFESEHSFESCMFCDKLDCPGRRAKYIGEY